MTKKLVLPTCDKCTGNYVKQKFYNGSDIYIHRPNIREPTFLVICDTCEDVIWEKMVEIEE